MNFDLIFKRIEKLKKTDCRNIVPAGSVIDVETLEVWKTKKDCARALGVSPAMVSKYASTGRQIKGRTIEEFTLWMWWSDAEKERWTRKNNIYFLRG